MTPRLSTVAQRRVTGTALGYDADVEDVHLRCGACGSLQTEPLASDEPLRAQVAAVTCLFCGRCGAMARAPRAPR